MTDYVAGTMINQTTLFTSSSLYAGNINAGNIAAGNVSVTGTLPPPVGIYANAANSLALATSGAAQVIVDPSGNVGIATGTPTAPLTVQSSAVIAAGSPAILIQGQSNSERMVIRAAGVAGVGTPVFSALAARGTQAAPTAVLSGDTLGYYQVGGYDGTAYLRNAWITGIATENWSATNRGGGLVFATTPNGSTTIAEAMRITGTGYVGIGTTSPGYSLVVYSNTNGAAVAQVYNPNTGGSAQSILQLQSGPSNYVNLNVQYNSNNSYFQIAQNNVPSSYIDFDTQYYRNASGTQNMRLDAGGNLYVGYTGSVAVNASVPAKAIVQGTGTNSGGGPYAFIMQGGSITAPVASTAYTVWTFAEYASTAFMLMCSYENNNGDGADQSAIFVDAGTSSYGAGFSVTKLTGGTIFTVARGGTTNARTITISIGSGGGAGTILQWQLFLLASTQG
jgi:hypothetical protein